MPECSFRTVATPAQARLVEKRSTFLADVRRVESEQEAQSLIAAKRREHPDARHTVYAFLLRDGTARYSDDAEPQGTAGKPVLEAIRRAGLSDVLLTVTRYFGGILLGAGGLTRAYAGAASAALQAAGVTEYATFCEYAVTCSYADHQRLMKALELLGARVRGTTFEAQICITVGILAEREEELLTCIRELTAGRVLPQRLSEGMDVIS